LTVPLDGGRLITVITIIEKSQGFVPLPALPETVAAYLTTVADTGLKAGSIQRRVSAISANSEPIRKARRRY
jgi:hypothetical protein